MKLSPNATCPCGSNNKYKHCCQLLHKGANAKSSLQLMKARYSAYVSYETLYLVKTTHWINSQYKEDQKAWSKKLLEFCKSTQFLKLKIIDHTYDTVTFKAFTKEGVLHEKSRFELVDGKWYYLDGTIYK